jgi:hypothetical protein
MSFSHESQKTPSARKNVSGMRPTVPLAQKVEKLLGERHVLQ